MRLVTDQCWERLASSPFGVLGTVDPDRGVHLVPVVFGLAGATLGVPVDTVKQKDSTRLRRVANLERDPRATLLVDHRSEHWQELWWVRADLAWSGDEAPDVRWQDILADRYSPYRRAGTIETVLTFEVARLVGWRAG
jgi:PPOX class probable F420-dependent enzyme